MIRICVCDKKARIEDLKEGQNHFKEFSNVSMVKGNNGFREGEESLGDKLKIFESHDESINPGLILLGLVDNEAEFLF